MTKEEIVNGLDNLLIRSKLQGLGIEEEVSGAANLIEQQANEIDALKTRLIAISKLHDEECQENEELKARCETNSALLRNAARNLKESSFEENQDLRGQNERLVKAFELLRRSYWNPSTPVMEEAKALLAEVKL